VHLCLDAAPSVVSAPVAPDCPAQILRCAERIIPGDGTGGGWLPWLSIFAWRDDRSRTALGDGVVTSARIVCAVRGHAVDVLIAESG